MCGTCGCTITKANEHLVRAGGVPAQSHAGTESVLLLRSLLSENDRIAIHNREHFDAHAVLAIDLMSAPGSGKTTLLERTIEELRSELRIAVIEGDLATENDALRIRAKGVPAIQITTGNACHLDAHMIHEALHSLPLAGLDVVFIENVGNLVCPASFDLGQHLNVTLLSVPEGDDKPQKYPVMFRASDLVLLTKCDLLQYLPEFRTERAEESLHRIACPAPILHLSSRPGASIRPWCEWLRTQLQRQRVTAGETHSTLIAVDAANLSAEV